MNAKIMIKNEFLEALEAVEASQLQYFSLFLTAILGVAAERA